MAVLDGDDDVFDGDNLENVDWLQRGRNKPPKHYESEQEKPEVIPYRLNPRTGIFEILNVEKYQKEGIIKMLDEILNDKDNISQLYKEKSVNRSGKTLDTKEYYTEVISGRLLEEIKKLKESIEPIDRKKGYRVDSHYEIISKTNTGRVEENVAKNLLWTNVDYLGRIIDFQVPLKAKASDNAGKIDLISFKDGEPPISYIIELKSKHNKETLLRAVLEIFTYYCQLNKGKFIESFEEYKHLEPKDIKKAVLLEEGSLAHNEYCEKKLRNRPKLKQLIKELDIDIFSFKLNVEKLC